MKDSINIGVVGLGGRGVGNLRLILRMDDVHVVSLCDLREARLKTALEAVKAAGRPIPQATTVYQEMLDRKDIDAICVFSGWNEHLPLCIEAMKAGKYVATEVGGANSIEQCWETVRVSERTGMPCMLLENCCYDRNEMTILNMVKQGLFGELVHAEGGYCHDLREHIALGYERDHFRHVQNRNRCGELYPTHELGPIAKWLNINKGNRMLTVSSIASKARGMNAWVAANRGADHPMASCPFTEGDVTITTIKCAHGETIMLCHNTSLPRPYSRRNVLQGTKGIWSEDKNCIYLEGISEKEDCWEPIDKYYEKYEHPLWKAYREGGKLMQNKEGHGGMDYLVQRAFFEAVMAGTQTPIDVYDTVSWMAVTCLSEDSIAKGGMPVAMPDFTNGRWFTRNDIVPGPYCLDEVCWKYFE